MSGLERFSDPREEFDLSRLNLQVELSPAHPDETCRTEFMRCGGCMQLAVLINGYCGQVMADCRRCGYAYAVWHHPRQCWQRESILGHSTERKSA